MTPKKKTPELIAILDGREMGRVTRDNRARLTFTYNEDWRTAENAYPLSISMPLALAQHANARIDTFLWGLLPDNQLVLDQWARKFHVSARNAFSLVSAVGEDCAGAVQFVRPERLEAILGAVPPEIEWLTEANIAQRLRALREDHSAWRIPRDTGQFSLAGAQPKTALLFENGRWGVPSGRIPTTHIFSSHRWASSPATPRTSISAWSWHALWGFLLSIPGLCVLVMKSPSSSNDTIAFAQTQVCGACIRKISARRLASLRRANTRMKADPASAISSNC